MRVALELQQTDASYPGGADSREASCNLAAQRQNAS